MYQQKKRFAKSNHSQSTTRVLPAFSAQINGSLLPDMFHFGGGPEIKIENQEGTTGTTEETKENVKIKITVLWHSQFIPHNVPKDQKSHQPGSLVSLCGYWPIARFFDHVRAIFFEDLVPGPSCKARSLTYCNDGFMEKWRRGCVYLDFSAVNFLKRCFQPIVQSLARDASSSTRPTLLNSAGHGCAHMAHGVCLLNAL